MPQVACDERSTSTTPYELPRVSYICFQVDSEANELSTLPDILKSESGKAQIQIKRRVWIIIM